VFEEGDLNYVTGVGKLGDRLIILVELKKILQRGELRRLGEVADAAAFGASA
jgi:chemotaxis signal transduction protein